MPQDEDWLDRIDSLTEEIVTSEHDELSTWTVTVQNDKTLEAANGDKEKVIFYEEKKLDLGIYDSFSKPIYTNNFFMCCYLNVGIEPRVGAMIERNRVRYRCLQKLNYALFCAYEGWF